MFAVRCPPSLLWHPSLHHSLLLLRALRQRHTLLLEPIAPSLPLHCSCSSCGPHLSITLMHSPIDPSAPNDPAADCTPSAECLTLSPAAPARVHTPRDILYFFAPTAAHAPLLHAYLDAAHIAWELCAAADNVLAATGAPDATRERSARLLDLLAALDASLPTANSTSTSTGNTSSNTSTSTSSSTGSGVGIDVDAWATWPLFAALRFLSRDAGAPLGPFPRAAAAITLLSASAPVRAHERLIARTIAAATTRTTTTTITTTTIAKGSGGEEAVGAAVCPWEGFVREALCGAAQDKESVSEPARTQSGRVGLQPVAARLPWTQRAPLAGKHMR